MATSNDRDETALRRYEQAIGDVLGVLNCLQLIADIDGFRRWIQSHHAISGDHRLFEGYKFTIETLIRMLHHEISYNRSLRLTEDDLFHRASFAGISFYKLPNSCEKNTILRNIAWQAEPIIQASQWQVLKESVAHFQHTVISPLATITPATVVSPQYKITDKDSAIRFATMFLVYIFLNDTSRGIPHGYHEPVFREDIPPSFGIPKRTRARLPGVFEGYKFAVQFLWHSILGERFGDTSLVRLHQASSWRDFDNFFEEIRREIIQPIEAEIGTLSVFDTVLLLKKPVKTHIRNLISHGPPEPRLSQKDSLERLFLWYDIQLIDGSDFNFAGVAAFIPMLIGLAETVRELQREGEKDRKVQVIRLVHGSPIEHRRDYSYAVLVQVGGIFSDASGWMLFYDCCSDAGSTSLLYKQAEDYIDRYERENLVSVAQRRVDKKRFLKLTKHRLVSLTKEQMHYLRAKV